MGCELCVASMCWLFDKGCKMITFVKVVEAMTTGYMILPQKQVIKLRQMMDIWINNLTKELSSQNIQKLQEDAVRSLYKKKSLENMK